MNPHNLFCDDTEMYISKHLSITMCHHKCTNCWAIYYVIINFFEKVDVTLSYFWIDNRIDRIKNKYIIHSNVYKEGEGKVPPS